MQPGDHVICKAGFWTGPSSAREKTVYEVVTVTDLSSAGHGDLPRLNLRALNGMDKTDVPENHYELVIRGASS